MFTGNSITPRGDMASRSLMLALNEGIFTQHAADVGVFAGLGKCAINSEKPRLGPPDIGAPRPGGSQGARYGP